MSTAQLSTEQAPAISVPLRFFAAAPLFLLLAAVILATNNPFADFSSPALLAATHCITLGFITMVMSGAMQQILPVVIGSPVPASAIIAWFTFVPMTAGTLSLAGGFLYSNPALLNTACLLLGFAFFIFVAACLISLSRASAKNPTKTAILFSVLALTGTVSLGILMAHGYASGMALDYPKLLASHLSLGLGGWVMLLIAGVSYQVVPMFQLTPGYPKWLTAGLIPVLLVTQLISLLSHWCDAVLFIRLSDYLFWLCASCFALVTLRLQSRRKRRIADATLSFYRLGMICLLGAVISSILPVPSGTLPAEIFILGFTLSIIFGMLYKIVPFLVWFHLFRGGVKKGVPNMKKIIPEVWMWRHLHLHTITLLAFLLAVFWNPAIWLAITGLALQGILLSFALYTGISVYRRTRIS